ncbi:MAG: DUF3572 domain-containing protein [Bosea sp. (in: a-proteobacteria)]
MKAMRENRDGAEMLAIRALGFLASEEDRLERFLALTGIDPGSVREAAREPGFLAAVLDHVSGDETMLLAFAANAGISPTAITSARHVLAGAAQDDSWS